jgi:tetratricopeptide (TPR) repeat protein
MRRDWNRLTVALCVWYAGHHRMERWAAACTAVVSAAVPVGRRAAGWAYNELGVIRRLQGRPADAVDELTHAVVLRRRRGCAQSRTNLGLALLDAGYTDLAIDQLLRSMRQRAGSDRHGHARTELGLGSALLAAGRPDEARTRLVSAANAFEAAGDERGYAAALTSLVVAEWTAGQRLDAAHTAERAIEVGRDAGDLVSEAAAALNVGALLLAAARPDPFQAREHLARSLALRAAAGAAAGGRGRALLYLGDAALALRGPASARSRWLAAAEVCERAGDEAGSRAAHRRLAGLDAVPSQLARTQQATAQAGTGPAGAPSGAAAGTPSGGPSAPVQGRGSSAQSHGAPAGSSRPGAVTADLGGVGSEGDLFGP